MTTLSAKVFLRDGSPYKYGFKNILINIVEKFIDFSDEVVKIKSFDINRVEKGIIITVSFLCEGDKEEEAKRILSKEVFNR